MAYKPSILDIAWMQRHVVSLKIGGIWGYADKPISFQRVGEKTMALIKGDESDPEIKEQIERNILVMKAAGITFVDKRGSRTTHVFRVGPDDQEVPGGA